MSGQFYWNSWSATNETSGQVSRNLHQSQRVTFLDFENEKTISVYSKNDSKYDKDNADYLMQAIKYKIISQAKKTDID